MSSSHVEITTTKDAVLPVAVNSSEDENSEILLRMEGNVDEDNVFQVAESDKMDRLYEAISENNWNAAKAILEENPSALTAKITSSGKTALHAAVMYGHVTLVEKLVKLVPPELLETKDDFGDTPLLSSTVTGITQIAECLVSKNKDTLGISNSTKELPIALALLNGHQQMGRYLYSITPLKLLTPPENGVHGTMVLLRCFQTKCLDIVLHLLGRCPELLFKYEQFEWGWSPIYGIATLNSAILPSKSELVFWKRLIYKLADINHATSEYIQQEDNRENRRAEPAKPGINDDALLKRLISCTYDFEGIKKMRELKLLHSQADLILRLVCSNVKKIKPADMKIIVYSSYEVNILEEALRLAAAEGNVEFILQISKANPQLLHSAGANIFRTALLHRQDRVFNLVHELRFKDALFASRDSDGNTMLHAAAKLAPPSVLSRIYGPALRMQRELQWFKEVERSAPPVMRIAKNCNGLTAEELFKLEHEELKKKGEAWIKNIAGACSVVSTLIVTIMFAATITLPGGNDQQVGYPLFFKKPFFKVFLSSAVLSFISSSISLLMFLAIFASRFSEEEFLKSIFTKLSLCLSSLYISVVSMIVAFLSTIRLVLKNTNDSLILPPIIILASLPILLFVMSQFPFLLRATFSSQRSLFYRKVKPWS
ncbi:uncharacterized protein LOC129312867 isoform X2 [Prosopis cineraria]|uniref:uncharacterized protein LOC129312867 isoform X2 n=1 Tax=Prosopis cineraria TaxID=364024 RepID=UPI00240F5075|nr:uncharacterized protein LOC129312867 isoform X2 [Prosopis cineraria]